MVILEQELKRYLALSALKNKPALGLAMYSRDVDNLWHTFILFTKEYREFCKTYAGRFIHHTPHIEKPSVKKTRNGFLIFVKNYEEMFKEEIHPIWLLDMCERSQE